MEMSLADCLKQKIHLVEEKHQSQDMNRGFDGDFWILFYAITALIYIYMYNILKTPLRLSLPPRAHLLNRTKITYIYLRSI